MRGSQRLLKANEESKSLSLLRERLARVPHVPGVYRWLDRKGNVLYVGKAKDLEKRMGSYVQNRTLSGPWKQTLLAQVRDFDFTVTRTELEALLLETNLIKELKPKFNVLMKDDKNYVYVKVAIADTYPSVDIVRRMDDRTAKYFGPFPSKGEVEKSLEMLHELFHFRACRTSIDTLNKGKRPSYMCLEFQIGRCNGLCAGKVSREEYCQAIDEVLRFFRGDTEHVMRRATERMHEAVRERKFERAARFRDMIHSMNVVKEKQVISDASQENMDVVGIALATKRAQVVVLRVREGKVVSEQAVSLQGTAENPSDAIEQFLPQYIESAPDLGNTIVVGEDFEGRECLEEFIAEQCRDMACHVPTKVHIIIPERGRKSQLLELAERNAREKLQAQEAAWEADRRNTDDALHELQSVLGLPSPPKRIEGYDISHLGGTETVGSMVVFQNGKATPDQYRSFVIKTLKEGMIDDYAALREVLKRRLRYITQNIEEEEKEWEGREITFGRAKKAEQKIILEVIKKYPERLTQGDINTREFHVARRGTKIIAFVRLHQYKEGLQELKSLWVLEDERGKKLGYFLIRKLLYSMKKGRVHVTMDPHLESYYTGIGFRNVVRPPKVLQERLEREQEEYLDHAPGLVMVYDTAQNKPDTSLTSHPDLLMIDGGKGQLNVALDVLHEMKRAIPVVALAKREEVLFVPGQSEPLQVSHDSAARFLLMRLRDEAHRRAHTHHELRQKKRVFQRV